MDSDPEIEFVEKDSGMSSLGGSKDETPERKPEIVSNSWHFSWNVFNENTDKLNQIKLVDKYMSKRSKHCRENDNYWQWCLHELQEDIEDDLEVEAVRIAVAEQMKGYDDVS